MWEAEDRYVCDDAGIDVFLAACREAGLYDVVFGRDTNDFGLIRTSTGREFTDAELVVLDKALRLAFPVSAWDPEMLVQRGPAVDDVRWETDR